jgi:hypothetical protein
MAAWRRRAVLLLGVAVGLVALVVVLPSILAILLSVVFGFVAGGQEIYRGTAAVLGIALVLSQRRFAGMVRLAGWGLAGAATGATLFFLWRGTPDPPDAASAAWADLVWLLLLATWSMVGLRRWDGPLLALLFATTRTGLLLMGVFVAVTPGPGDPPGIEPAVTSFLLMAALALGAFLLVAMIGAALGALLLMLGEKRGRWLVAGLCLADAAWQLSMLR